MGNSDVYKNRLRSCPAPQDLLMAYKILYLFNILFIVVFIELYFQTLLQNFEKRLLVSSYLYVWLVGCPSVRMEQLGYHWTNFHEI